MAFYGKLSIVNGPGLAVISHQSITAVADGGGCGQSVLWSPPSRPAAGHWFRHRSPYHTLKTPLLPPPPSPSCHHHRLRYHRHCHRHRRHHCHRHRHRPPPPPPQPPPPLPPSLPPSPPPPLRRFRRLAANVAYLLMRMCALLFSSLTGSSRCFLSEHRAAVPVHRQRIT